MVLEWKHWITRTASCQTLLSSLWVQLKIKTAWMWSLSSKGFFLLDNSTKNLRPNFAAQVFLQTLYYTSTDQERTLHTLRTRSLCPRTTQWPRWPISNPRKAGGYRYRSEFRGQQQGNIRQITPFSQSTSSSEKQNNGCKMMQQREQLMYTILSTWNSMLFLEELTSGSRDAAFSVAGQEPACKAKRKARLHCHLKDTVRNTSLSRPLFPGAGSRQIHLFLLSAAVLWQTEDKKVTITRKKNCSGSPHWKEQNSHKSEELVSGSQRDYWEMSWKKRSP